MSIEIIAILVTVGLAITGGVAKLIQVLINKSNKAEDDKNHEFNGMVIKRLDQIETLMSAMAKNSYASDFKFRSKDDCAIVQGALEAKLRAEFRQSMRDYEDRMEARFDRIEEYLKDIKS